MSNTDTKEVERMHGFGSGMGGGWLIWIILIGLIVWVVVTLTKRNRGGSSLNGPRETDALDLLKKRFARGDISKEEFEDKKRDLQD